MGGVLLSGTKKAIMEAAIGLFLRCGFANTTMRMIAKEANISVGALYLHFKNKEDLCIFILRQKLEELTERILQAIEKENKAELKLKAFFKTCIDYARKNSELIIAGSKEKGLTFGLEVKRDYYRRQSEILREIFVKGIRDGEFRNVDPDCATKIVLSLVRGFVLSMILGEDLNFKEEELFSILLQGLKPEERRPL